MYLNNSVNRLLTRSNNQRTSSGEWVLVFRYLVDPYDDSLTARHLRRQVAAGQEESDLDS